MIEPIKLPPPHGYIYVWDGPYGTHRLTAGQYNGRQCDRAVAYYTEDQVRAAIEADRKHTDDLIARYQEKIRALEAENYALISESGDRQARGAPVGEVFTMEPLDGSGDVRCHALLSKPLPAGTKLYTAPQPQQQAGDPVGYFFNVNSVDERPRWEQVSDEYKNDHDVVALYTAPQPPQQARGEPVKVPSHETIRLVGVIANKIEDGTLFNGGIFSRKELAEKVREVLIFAAQPELKSIPNGAMLYTTPQPQQIPKDYKLVPIEPTPEMLKSGWAENDVPLALRWKAMLEAAPEVKG